MKPYFVIFFPFFIIIYCGCQKDIGFGKIEFNYSQQLFIEGLLYPDEIPKIYLSSSLPFFHEKVSPQQIFVKNAIVVLSGADYSETLQADSIFDKFRCRWNPFYGGSQLIEYGKTYYLKVTYEGKTYTASTTIDQPRVNITSVQYTPDFYDVYGGHDGVILKVEDPAGIANHYRFQMDRIIENTRKHAHILDVLTNNCTEEGELFQVTDLGRTIFSDGPSDGQPLQMNIEVSFEYEEGDNALIYLQSLDNKSAGFYDDLDKQLQSILNPFVEPVFLHSTIEGVLGVFGSAVRSDPVVFVYPQDNP